MTSIEAYVDALPVNSHLADLVYELDQDHMLDDESVVKLRMAVTQASTTS